jgi:hypothetical protein
MRNLLLPGLFVLLSQISEGQNSATKIAGRVYVQYSKPTTQQKVAVYSKYITEIKVILVPSLTKGDVIQIKNNMKLFCGNDRQAIQRFNARIVYTDRNGNFEFSGVRTGTTYFVMFCDKQMQMSEITTGNKPITYRIMDKEVYL